MNPTITRTIPAIPTPEEAPFDPRAMSRNLGRVRSGKLELSEASSPEVARHLTYTDRESYLAWVTEWKAAYRELSAAQRSRKAEIRNAGSSATGSQWWALLDGRTTAQLMLFLRAAAKADSWARHEAERAGQKAV